MSGYRTVAYFVNWAIYDRKHRPQDLPVEKLTHVLYAFANVNAETGEVSLTDSWSDVEIHWEGDSWNDEGTNLYGCLKQLNLLKARNRNLKVSLSIGGWSYRENFAHPASTPEGRATFARSSVDLLKNVGFDGLDIDWEYPENAEQAADFVELLRCVRRELDDYAATLPNTPRLELTVAAPAGPEQFHQLDVPGMDPYLDFWNIMTYDLAGSWSPVAGHAANLFCSSSTPDATALSATSALDFYKEHVAADKLVVGMPLYGRAFAETDGLGQPFSGTGAGTWEAGLYDYAQLPLPDSHEDVDSEAVAASCYNPDTKLLVSYDNLEVARQKAEYIKDQGLGGAMWWESSSDKKDEGSIISAVFEAFGGQEGLLHQENNLEYPESKYDNLRNGELKE